MSLPAVYFGSGCSLCAQPANRLRSDSRQQQLHVGATPASDNLSAVLTTAVTQLTSTPGGNGYESKKNNQKSGQGAKESACERKKKGRQRNCRRRNRKQTRSPGGELTRAD